jgi:hypothetical protein
MLAALDVAESQPTVWIDRDYRSLVQRIAEYRCSPTAVKDFIEHRHQEVLPKLGRQFLGVGHAILGQYATRVEISRQTTSPIRGVANAIFNLIRRAGRLLDASLAA